MKKLILIIALLLITTRAYAGIKLSFSENRLSGVEIKVKSFNTYFWNASGINYWYVDSIIEEIDKIGPGKLKERLEIIKTLCIQHKQAHIAKQFEKSQKLAKEIVEEFEKIKTVGSMVYFSVVPVEGEQ